jgi:hypothetical protein
MVRIQVANLRLLIIRKVLSVNPRLEKFDVQLDERLRPALLTTTKHGQCLGHRRGPCYYDPKHFEHIALTLLIHAG